MSHFLKKHYKKAIITMLVTVMVLLGIPKVEKAANEFTLQPLYPNSTRTMGEVLRSDIVNGKKIIKVKFPSNITSVKYGWNLNLSGEKYTSTWLKPANGELEIPVNIYNNGKNIPLGLLELCLCTWDGKATTTSWSSRPYYVVDKLTAEENQDAQAPKVIASNFVMPTNPEEMETHPIKVKLNETNLIMEVRDIAQANSNPTGVYYYKAELLKDKSQINEYTSKAVSKYGKSQIKIGYGSDADIKLPAEKGLYYVQMYAIDGSRNVSKTYWLKIEIKGDITPPNITLNKDANGNETQYIEVGNTYRDLGAIANDDIDGAKNAVANEKQIQAINTALANNQTGEYKITYTAKDSENNEATPVERTVYVVNYANLRDKINKIETELKEEDYTEEKWEELQEILEQAKNMINTNKSKQEEIDKKVEDITNAIENLIIETPLVQDVQVKVVGKEPNADRNYYIKVGDKITVEFSSGNTPINTIDELTINGITKTGENIPNINLEKLEGTGNKYRFTYTFTEADNQTQNGFITYAFTLLKKVGEQEKTTSTALIASNSIIFDKTAPTIRFENPQTANKEIYVNEKYTEDTTDIIVENDLKADVKFNITGSVDNETAGTYEITYTVTDKAGNTSNEIKRKVKVKDYSDLELKPSESDNMEFDETNNKYTIEYDGQMHNLTIDTSKLPAGVTVGYKYIRDNQEVSTNGVKNAGTYTVKVVFTVPEGVAFNPPAEISTVLEIKPVVINVKIDDKSSIYGEEIKQLTSNITSGEVIGEDSLGIILSVKQDANTALNNASPKGTYTITGTHTNTNYDVRFSNGTYTIEPATIDVTGLTFGTDEKVMVDYKEPYQVELIGTKPTGIKEIKYEYYKGETKLATAPTDSGEYKIVAKFVTIDSNYTVPADKEGKLIINKIAPSIDDITPTIPTTGEYNGEAKSATITSKLVAGELGTITPKYYSVINDQEQTEGTNNAPINAGKYNVKAVIAEGKNYLGAEIPVGSFEILKREITIKPNDQTGTYQGDIETDLDYAVIPENGILSKDESTILISVTSTVPLIEGKIGAIGTFDITAVATKTNPNYNITFEKGTYTVNRATYQLEGITFENSSAEYTGEEIKKEIAQTLPQGVKVAYEYKNNKTGEILGTDATGKMRYPVEVGTYTVKATFTLESPLTQSFDAIVVKGTNSNTIEALLEITAKTPTINELKVTMPDGKVMTGVDTEGLIETGTSKEKARYEYNGQTRNVTIVGADNVEGLGEILEIKYYPIANGTEYPEATPKNVGRYRVKAKIAKGDNYAKVEEIVIGEFEITKKEITTNDINISYPTEGAEIEYTGSGITPTVQLPNEELQLNLTYLVKDKTGNYVPLGTGKVPTDVGEYRISVKINENSNYTLPTSGKEVNFKITPKDISEGDVTVTVALPEKITYTEGMIPREVTVTADENKVTYEVEYYEKSSEEPTSTEYPGFKKIAGAPTEAGIYKVLVKVSGKGNYQGDLSDIKSDETFEIEKAEQDAPEVTLNPNKVQYPVTEKLALNFTNRLNAKGNVEYELDNNSIIDINETGEITVKKAGTVNITVKYTGNKNYKESKTKMPITLTIEGNVQPLPELSLTKDGKPFTEFDSENNPKMAFTDESEIKLVIGNSPVEQENGKPGSSIKIIGDAQITPDNVIRPKTGNKFTPGEIEITVTFKGTTNYSENSNTIKLIITKDTLKSEDFVVTNNENQTYEVDESGNAIAKYVDVDFTDKIKQEGLIKTDITAVKYYKITGEFTSNTALKDIEADMTKEIEAKEAGDYLVVIDVKATDKYEEVEGLRIGILKINRAKYDLTGKITFADKEVPYNTNKQKLEVVGLPSGINVSYEYTQTKEFIGGVETEVTKTPIIDNLGVTDAGTYAVKANLELSEDLSKNYSGIVKDGKDINELNAVLKITRIPYPMPAEVSFANSTVDYNKEKQAILVQGLPDLVTVNYEYTLIKTIENGVETEVIDKTPIKDNEGVKDAGIYSVKATFTLSETLSKNYVGIKSNNQEITEMTATLTINKIKPSKEDFEISSKTCVYSGTSKADEVQVTKLSEGLGEYTKIFVKDDGTKTEEPINAGTYSVKLTVTEGKNYIARGEFTAVKQFIIEKAIPEYKYETVTAVVGQKLKDVNLPKGFEFTENLETPVGEVGLHEFTGKYTPDAEDINNYNVVEGIKLAVNVVAKEMDDIAVSLNGEQTFYVGNPISKNSLIVEGIYNDGSKVTIPADSYEINPKTVTGEGTITLTVTYNGMNETIEITGTAKKEQVSPNAHIELSGKTVDTVKITSKIMPVIVLEGTPEETPTVTYEVKGDNKTGIITLNEDGEIESLNSAGEVTIVITYLETTSYNSKSQEIKLKVEKDDLKQEDFEVTDNEYDYGIDDITKLPIVRGVTVTPKEGIDISQDKITKKYYKVTGKILEGTKLEDIETEENETENPTNYGKYVVEIVIGENSKYNSGTLKIGLLTIKKISQVEPNVTINPMKVTKSDEAPKLTINNTPYESGEISYASSDENVLTIDETGKITIVGPGKANITVTFGKTENYKEKSKTIENIIVLDELEKADFTVSENIYRYALDASNAPIVRNAKVEVNPETGLTKDDIEVKYYKINKEIADNVEVEDIPESDISKEETENPSTSGKYVIVVHVPETENYAEATINLGILTINKAEQKVPDVQVNPMKVTKSDEAPELTVNNTPYENGKISYTSSDESVLTVNEEGKITIVSPGKASITVTFGKTANYTEKSAETEEITILDELEKTDFTVTNFERDYGIDETTKKPINTGATVIAKPETGLNASDYVVNYYKVIGEIKPGEEINTEKTPIQKPENAGKYVIEVEVSETANYGEAKIRLDEIFTINAIQQVKPEMTLSKNPVYMTDEAPVLTLTNAPYENGTITYTSSNESVITIDENGIITIVGAGEADITVTYGKTDNYTANSNTIPLAVERADLKKEYFELDEEKLEVEYTGNPQSVIIERTLKDGKPIVPITDVASEDITIHYYKVENSTETKQEPINQGTYNVYITVEQTKKYKEITEENKIKLGQLVIKRAKIQSDDIEVLNSSNIEYSGKDIEANIDILNTVLEANINKVNPPVTITKKYYKHTVNGAGEEELVEVAKPKEVGTYTVKVVIPEMENYEATSSDGLEIGEMTIIPKSQKIIVTIDDKSSEYGYLGATLTWKITSGEICEDDTLDDLGITMKVIDENKKDVTDKIKLLPVGNYSIIGEANNENYDITVVNGNYEVKPRNVTVKIKDKTSVYGKTRETLEYDDTQVVLAEDGVALGINLYIVDTQNDNIKIVDGKIVEGTGKIVVDKETAEEGEILFSKLNVGDYKIVGEAENKNYNVTFTNVYENNPENKKSYGTYSITPAEVSKEELEITMPEDKIYDGEEKEVVVEGKTGIVGLGETINVKYYFIDDEDNVSENSLSGKPVNAGSYLVKAEISNGTNYNEANLEIGTLTISKREITETNKDVYLKYILPGELNEKTGIKEVEWEKDTKYPAIITLTDKFRPINTDITITILYNGKEIENGPDKTDTYNVTVTVSGNNFYTEAPVSIGSFKVVDNDPPVITLIGEKELEIEVSIDGDKSYIDAGATAEDNYDGDITDRIVVDNQVDINTVGTYVITYTVVDSAGNTGTETRTVEVVKRRQEAPLTSLVDLDAENPEDRIFSIAVTELGFDLYGTLTNKPIDKRGITYSINTESAEKISVNTSGYVSFKDWGEASISITYGETSKYYSATSTLPINITRGDLLAENFELLDAEYEYTQGVAHTVDVTAFKDNLLLRSKIGEYEVVIKDKDGNEYKNSSDPSEGPVNAGDYTVAIRKGTPADTDWFNATSEDLVIGTFKIEKAKYDMTNVAFDSLSAVYSGERQNVDLSATSKAYLQAQGITYEIECSPENLMDAGKYTVTAKFTGDKNNYEDIEDLVAEYEITKKVYTKSEIDGITMQNSVITYDENDPQVYKFALEQSYIANLGITAVSYSPEDAIKPGTYTITIVLKADKNHEFPAPTSGWAKPNEITRTVKIVENVTPPRISLITSGTGDNERRQEINPRYDSVENPMAFAKIMKFRWNKGIGTVTKVDSTGAELEVIETGEGPKTVELKKDGIYKIESVLNPGNGEKDLVTTRYVRIARNKIKFKDTGDVKKFTEGNITGIYYISDVDVKLSSFDNLSDISLDITAEGGTKQTINRVVTSDGVGNIVVARPSGGTDEISYTISENSDGTLSMKLSPKAGYTGKIKVDIKATRINTIIVDENKIEFESEQGVDVKTIDFMCE